LKEMGEERGKESKYKECCLIPSKLRESFLQSTKKRKEHYTENV